MLVQMRSDLLKTCAALPLCVSLVSARQLQTSSEIEMASINVSKVYDSFFVRIEYIRSLNRPGQIEGIV